MKIMRKQTNIIMGAMALVMLVTMMGVVVSGLTEVTDGVRVAVVEKRDTGDVIARNSDDASSDRTQNGVANSEKTLENNWGFNGQVAVVDEAGPEGYRQPLGESVTTGPEKTEVFAVVANIQLAMLGVVGIGIVAILLLMWQGSKKF